MATPSGRPSTITPEPTPQSHHIILSNEESISSQASLTRSINIYGLPQYLTKITPTDPRNATLHKKSVKPLSIHTLNLFHRDSSNLCPIPTSSKAETCENLTQFESLNLHRIFGCRQFHNKKHLTAATNASLVKSGLLPSTIREFSTIANPNKGNPIKKRHHYLEKVYMEIVFGDCVALWGHWYDLLLFDVATKYCWLYGMSSLSSTSITSALELFKADALRLTHRFHSDFDKKSIVGNYLQWMLSNSSNIIAAPTRRQYSNGLAERTWRTLIQMAQEFIIEKQAGREFWYFMVWHAEMMLNQVPGRLGLKLTTPFEVVHNSKPYSKTWFELFSIG